MKIRVGESSVGGRGVFAAQKIGRGEVVEVCPVIVVPKKNLRVVDESVFWEYCYGWGAGVALALGYGSLYNHSGKPNAYFELRKKSNEIVIVAEQKISVGEEITISYGEPEDLWFEEKPLT